MGVENGEICDSDLRGEREGSKLRVTWRINYETESHKAPKRIRNVKQHGSDTATSASEAMTTIKLRRCKMVNIIKIHEQQLKLLFASRSLLELKS